MKPHFYMHHFILLVAWLALGGCWPMFEAERHPLDLKIARDSQPVGSSTTNNSAITAQTMALGKEINSALAGLVLLLTVGTYGILMRYTTRLSNEIILPSSFVGENVAAILSKVWPKSCEWSRGDPDNIRHNHWILYYKQPTVMEKPDKPAIHGYSPQGFSDIKESFERGPENISMVGFKIFSPVMKDLVHVAIWNSISFWLVLVMFVNTLVYNGFVSKNITADSKIRLFLVGVYAVTNIGHQIYTTTLLYQNFTSALFQACWTYIGKSFIFLSSQDYGKDPKTRAQDDVVWTCLNLELFGTTERSKTYRFPLKDDDPKKYTMKGSGEFETLSADDQGRWSYLIARDKTESNFDKFVKPLREAEIKVYEKATDSTLEKTLVNVGVLTSICFATALAPWTSVQTSNATNAQLGSYALLLSISTGLFALLSSLTQLAKATESTKLLLQYQEKTIAASRHNHETEFVSEHFSIATEALGFSEVINEMSPLTWFNLWKSTSLLSILPCLLFGPALVLIPRLRYGNKRPGGWMYFAVKNVTFRSSFFPQGVASTVRMAPEKETSQEQRGSKPPRERKQRRREMRSDIELSLIPRGAERDEEGGS